MVQMIHCAMPVNSDGKKYPFFQSSAGTSHIIRQRFHEGFIAQAGKRQFMARHDHKILFHLLHMARFTR